jgi:hypothetical protein
VTAKYDPAPRLAVSVMDSALTAFGFGNCGTQRKEKFSRGPVSMACDQGIGETRRASTRLTM